MIILLIVSIKFHDKNAQYWESISFSYNIFSDVKVNPKSWSSIHQKNIKRNILKIGIFLPKLWNFPSKAFDFKILFHIISILLSFFRFILKVIGKSNFYLNLYFRFPLRGNSVAVIGFLKANSTANFRTSQR